MPRIEQPRQIDNSRGQSRDLWAGLRETTQVAGTGSIFVTAMAVRAMIEASGSMRGGWDGVSARLQSGLAGRAYLPEKYLDDVFGPERLVRIARSSGVPVRSIRALLNEAIPRLLGEFSPPESELRALLDRLSPDRVPRPYRPWSRRLPKIAVLAAAVCLAWLAAKVLL